MTRVFISWFEPDRLYYECLRDALRYEKIEVKSSEELFPSDELQEAVVAAIRQCHVFIAIINRPHHSIMLEVGCALGTNKKVLLVRDPASPMIRELKTLRSMMLDPFDPKHIDEIISWVRENSPKNFIDFLLVDPAEITLKSLIDDPANLDSVSPKLLNDLIANFIRTNLNKDVHIQDDIKDAGYDIEMMNDDGTNTLIEIKKYSSNRSIPVSEVQRMLGVAVSNKASGAMIITSGQFTSSAKYFAETSPIKIELLTLENLLSKQRE